MVIGRHLPPDRGNAGMSLLQHSYISFERQALVIMNKRGFLTVQVGSPAKGVLLLAIHCRALEHLSISVDATLI